MMFCSYSLARRGLRILTSTDQLAVSPHPTTLPVLREREKTVPSVGSIAQRPAVAAAGLLIAGIACNAILPHRPLVWIGAIAALAIGAVATFKSRWTSSLCLAGAIFLCGLTLAQLESYCFPADHISAYATDEPRLAEMELRIDHPPRILATP